MLIQTVVLIALVVVLLALVAISLLYSVSGTWERVGDVNAPGDLARDRITLGQFGPIVVGRREVVGGYQSFFGFAFARTLWLKRRDYGVVSLAKQGFPEDIAKLIEGQVMVRLKLTLSPDKLFLNGQVKPYKVEFTRKPARVTAMLALEPTGRSYRRAELVSAKATAPQPVASE
jgi:hypothetical protein